MFFTDALRESRHMLHLLHLSRAFGKVPLLLLAALMRASPAALLPAHLALTLLFILGRARLSYCASLSAAPVLLLPAHPILPTLWLWGVALSIWSEVRSLTAPRAAAGR